MNVFDVRKSPLELMRDVRLNVFDVRKSPLELMWRRPIERVRRFDVRKSPLEIDSLRLLK